MRFPQDRLTLLHTATHTYNTQKQNPQNVLIAGSSQNLTTHEIPGFAVSFVIGNPKPSLNLNWLRKKLPKPELPKPYTHSAPRQHSTPRSAQEPEATNHESGCQGHSKGLGKAFQSFLRQAQPCTFAGLRQGLGLKYNEVFFEVEEL